MAIFYYTGFGTDGKTVKGHIEASNTEMAQRKLKSQNIFVQEINEDINQRDRLAFPVLSKFINRVPRKEVSLFCNQLATLLDAGLSLNIALRDLIDQTRNVTLRKVLVQIHADIIQGVSLSQAFAKHSEVFPAVYEQMIQVGEHSGSYAQTLYRLAELEDKNEELKDKAFTALIYPVIMLGVSFLVVIFLLVAVVPQLQTLFSSFDATLPLPTKIVLGVSNFLQKFWSLVIIVIFGSFLGLEYVKKKEKGKLFFDQTILRLPLIGAIVQKVQVSRFTRNLGTLLDTKVSLVDALGILLHTTTNSVFRCEIVYMIEHIKIGDSIKKSISHSVLISEMGKAMIIAGENADKLAEMFLKVADILEKEIDTSIKKLTNSLEPLMLVVMGGLVFGIMVSIMLPIYQLTKHIN